VEFLATGLLDIKNHIEKKFMNLFCSKTIDLRCFVKKKRKLYKKS
jgi:hypothetical protein